MSLYLDHAATTPVRREVLEAITPILTAEFGNPSSAHSAGERCASQQVAREVLRGRDESRHRPAGTGSAEASKTESKSAARSAVASSGRTDATYWSGRTTTTAPDCGSIPRSA